MSNETKPKKRMPISSVRVPIKEEVKERIIKRMIRERQGLLEAAKASQISPTRVMDDLLMDKPFMSRVEAARRVIAEYLSEELRVIADEPASTRDEVTDKQLRLKARYHLIETLVPKSKQPASPKQPDQQHVTVSQEQQAAMAEAHAQFERLYGRDVAVGEAVDAGIVEEPQQYQPEHPEPEPQPPRELSKPELQSPVTEPSVAEPLYLRSRANPWLETEAVDDD
jgi:terminase small subunit-like protein